MRVQSVFRRGGIARGLGSAKAKGGYDLADYIICRRILTFYERRFELRGPDDFALALDGLPALSARDDGLDRIARAARVSRGIIVGEVVRGGNPDVLLLEKLAGGHRG